MFSNTAGLVGLAPSSIAPGAVLVLGKGDNFPFLMLRSAENHYEFRGLAMVHGLNLDDSLVSGWTDERLDDFAAWAGITQEPEWFEI